MHWLNSQHSLFEADLFFLVRSAVTAPCVIVIETASVAKSAAVLALLKASHEHLQHLRSGAPALTAIELLDQQ